MMFVARLYTLLCITTVVLFSLPALAQTEGTATQVLAFGPYAVRPILNSSACMDVSGSNPANGSVVQSYSCNSTSAQSWSLAPVSTSLGIAYQVVTAISGSCLDVSGVSLNNGAQVHEWQCVGATQTNQLWQIYPFANGYELVSMNSGKCLDLPNGNSSNGVQLQQWTCGQGTNPNQLWSLVSFSPEGAAKQGLASGPYTVKPILNGSACMDVSGSNPANGSIVQSYSCNSTNAQSWSLAPVSTSLGSAYQLVSSISGSCLDVSDVSLNNGAQMHEWQCLGATQTNQLWQMYPFGNGYELVSLNSGKCLDLPNGNSSNGVQLQQWTCGQGTNPNQLWNLVPLSTPTPSVIVTSTSLLATPATVLSGQPVVLNAQPTATLGTVAGSVKFFDGGNLLGTSTCNGGKASFTAQGLNNGTHVMTAQYAGTTVYAPSSSQQLQVTVVDPSVGEQALPADSFVDSIGVNTHLTYQDTPYWSAFPTIFSKLQALGVRHIRDGYYNWPSTSPFYAEHQKLAAAGIGTDYVFSIDNTTTPQVVQGFAANVRDLESIEAPNECDAGANCGGGNLTGVNNAVSFMTTLHAVGQTLSVPVLGPSFTTDWAYSDAGQLSSQMTYNNIHVYFGGRNPGSAGWGGGDAQGNSYGSFAWWIDQAHSDAPSLPVVITETGYMSYAQTSTPYTLPESVEASYIPRTLALAFNHGIPRTYMYELLDEISSPAYGLLHSDLSVKPAYTAVKTLISTLADPGTSFTPAKLDYTLAGADTSLNHMLLQKRDGSFWLILWLEQSSYNPATNAAIKVTSQNVTLALNGGATVTQVLQMDTTGNSIGISKTGSNVSLPISDQMTILLISR